MRNPLYNLLGLILLITCGSCAPSVQNTKDTSDASSEVPWDSCSYNIGDHPCNFKLMNQHGEVVNLYDFYGHTIVIDFSAMWCGPCASAASEVQDVKDKLEEKGFTYLTVLIENSMGQPPNPEDCASWAATYGISEPVLAGDRSLVDPAGIEGWSLTSWPTFFFITEDMIIHSTLKGFSSTYIDHLILEAMQEGS